jgi:crossover junction endodeoxyribonuclease RuvC
MPTAERIIMGVDPGTTIMGFGVIKATGKKLEMITLDVIKLQKLDDHLLRLKNIFEKTLWILEEFKPDEMAIEAPFFGKNVQSMLKLGRAQGVVMAAALYRNIPVTEYSPRRIKQSITGKGGASKEQVSAMLQRLYHFETTPKYLDATDGLAVATCHAFQHIGNTADALSTKKGGRDWSSFVKNNPNRLK